MAQEALSLVVLTSEPLGVHSQQQDTPPMTFPQSPAGQCSPVHHLFCQAPHHQGSEMHVRQSSTDTDRQLTPAAQVTVVLR